METATNLGPNNYGGAGFSGGSDRKESACNSRDLGLILGLGRSPGEEKGYPLHYSGLENSMDYSPWNRKVRHVWATFTFTFTFTTKTTDFHFIFKKRPSSRSRAILYMLNPWRDQAELLVTQSLLRTKLNIFQKRLHNLDLSNKISTVSSIKAKIQDMLMNRESIVRRHRHIDYTDSRIIRQDIDITMINVFKDLKNKWI